MGLQPLLIFKFFQYWDRLYTSESDVLTYKNEPLTERVKPKVSILLRDTGAI